MQKLGAASYGQSQHPNLGRVVHDIKGGGFLALSIYLQLLEFGLYGEDDFSRLFFLTRDHRKIMRNAVQQIDPAGEIRDSQEIEHNVSLLAEKWYDALHQVRDGTVAARIHLDCRYTGSISESCLEFAALDRVLYNLINNSAQHTADGQVYFAIFPPDEDTVPPADLRFVVYNRSTPEHLRLLAQRYDETMGELFLGGFTTGGTGHGLRICAEFVTNAYGLQSVEQAIAERYCGAARIDEFFVNWIHWPTSDR
ncbi:MAG: hypothetical protein HC876_15890 [Chloroflexaceae bacterium]|nr:hypothetical protein [Chloroflexaceae bacterium]